MRKLIYLKGLFLGFTFVLSSIGNVNSQELDIISDFIESKPQIMITSRTHNGGIDLRWAPNDHILFRIANRKGYRLEKKEVGTAKWEVLLDRGPFTVEEFMSKLDTSNIHVATAAQCVYGEQKAPSNPADFMGAAKEIEEEQNMRYAFSLMSADYNSQAAEGLALGFRDENIIDGKSYIYRLYIRDLSQDYPAMDTTSITVNTNYKYEISPVQKFLVIPENDHIVLKWDKDINKFLFSGYYIERSEDNGKTFIRINDQPIVTSDNENFKEFNVYNMYSDDKILPERKYIYRVVGVTPFGDEGLPSIEIETKSRDFQGPLPPRNVVADDQLNGSLIISWEIESISNDQAGFMVWRSDNPLGPFYPIHEKLLSNTTTDYIDKTAMPIRSNYYMVYAVDKVGNKNGSSICMGVWKDSTPPAMPVGLAGYVDTLGHVTLAWAYGDEPDLRGYLIYWSNGIEREFYPVSSSPVEGNIFLDSINLKTSTEKIYYKVIAVDFNMNQSEPSDILELERPDLNPPASPLLKNFIAHTDSISIFWYPSPSADVIGYQILRKLPESEKYDIIHTIQSLDVTSFTDHNVEGGVTYEYAIVAVDDALLHSELSSPYVITALRGMRKPFIADLNGSIDEESVGVKLTWSYQDAGDFDYVVYRNDDDKGWQVLAMLENDTPSFLDQNIYRAETNFKYAVKVMYKNGAESPLSNIVTLSF